MARNKYSNPKCKSNGKGKCFACNRKGYCTALENTDFKNFDGTQRECPFKKHPEQLKKELQEVKKRLEIVYNLKYNKKENHE